MRLELEQDVDGGPVRYRALAAEPWLRMVDVERYRSHWISLRYRTGFFEDPVRPLIRFRAGDGSSRTFPMNGAVAGAAQWIGRVPDDTVAVSVSPTNRMGAFGFALESLEPVSLARVLRTGFARDPALTLLGIGAKVIGSRDEARHCLAFAIGGTSFEQYDAWARTFVREPDMAGVDRTDWTAALPLRLLLGLPREIAAMQATISSLQRQVFENWTLHAFAPTSLPDEIVSHYRACMAKDRRLALMEGEQGLASIVSADEFVACLEPGQLLPPTALGAIASAILRDPGGALFYGDEDVADGDGRLRLPAFKPDFDATFLAGRFFIGRGAFLRGSELEGAGCSSPTTLMNQEAYWTEKLSTSGANHVRRIIHRRRMGQELSDLSDVVPSRESWPDVEIVIPSRDRSTLLGSCIDGLRHRTDYPALNVTVVDNGTTEHAALRLLKKLELSAGFKVLRSPGPFNFAALCNLGAAATTAAVLVFLNNDIEIDGSDWLKRLVTRAIQPSVGVVGAKLLYPDGRLQHAGVVLGMGEMATHAYRQERDQRGYLDRLAFAHEVSAVTGAVMAVAHSKFDAVGGFDAASFPVLYNDTDLCLRLAAHGWRTVLEPRASLLHRESASRGRPSDPFTRHGEERRIFHERWKAVIRDDPYFHPALSLYSYRLALS